jgi:hypothetical protein
MNPAPHACATPVVVADAILRPLQAADIAGIRAILVSDLGGQGERPYPAHGFGRRRTLRRSLEQTRR